MDDVTQENVATETRTKGPALVRSKPPGKSELRASDIKRRKKVAHRRKLKASHASG